MSQGEWVRRWLAIAQPFDTVKLVPTPESSVGPDVFVKASELDDLTRQLEDEKAALALLLGESRQLLAERDAALAREAGLRELIEAHNKRMPTHSKAWSIYLPPSPSPGEFGSREQYRSGTTTNGDISNDGSASPGAGRDKGQT